MDKDFNDLLFAFNEFEVRYLIVGGYAYARYAEPRATKDLDLFIRPDPVNASAVYKALAAYGASLDNVTTADFASPATIFQIGVAPYRVDIITRIDGLTFDEAWGDAESLLAMSRSPFDTSPSTISSPTARCRTTAGPLGRSQSAERSREQEDMKPKQSTITPESRAATLDRQRRLKMARSAHAYVRGNTIQFYEWLASGSGDKLPKGPHIWICGDCHAGNLGPVADAEGHVAIQIRDLDQTVIGNPAHDLVRLGLSLATAARGSDLPGVTTALMLEQMVLGYTQTLQSPRKQAADTRADDLRPIHLTLRQSLSRKWRHLAEERIEDVTPHIPLGERFWALSKEERTAIEALIHTAPAHTLLVGDSKQHIPVLDAAYWMKGCSSLGRLRFAVLIGIGKKKDRHFRLLDLKEAVPAAAPAAPEADMPVNHAERVVCGAKALSPHLGERMVAATLLRRPVVVRELMPQDLKVELERLTREEAIAAAHYLATVVGRAHVRQMDPAARKCWKAELSRNHSKSLEAPNWLWRSVVELVASHEAAYLDHCRRYAMETATPKS